MINVYLIKQESYDICDMPLYMWKPTEPEAESQLNREFDIFYPQNVVLALVTPANAKKGRLC